MQINTQIRVSPTKIAVLYQLYNHKITGKLTVSRLISEAVLEVFRTVKNNYQDKIVVFDSNETAAEYLKSEGFLLSQLGSPKREEPQGKVKLDLSTALELALMEREKQTKENQND